MAGVLKFFGLKKDAKPPAPKPEDKKPIVMPTEDTPDVRRAMLEEERKARMAKGRDSTRTPGYAQLGGRTILG